MAVTPTDIAVELGRTAPEPGPELAQWESWINDALMLISARLVGTRTGQVASLDDLDPNRVDYVVRQAVAAHIRHPEDVTRVEVHVDDGSTAKQYKSGRGRVTIIDEWWNLLSPKPKSGGAFSIIPTSTGTPHPPWCSLHFGGTCSCGVTIAGGPIYEPWGD